MLFLKNGKFDKEALIKAVAEMDPANRDLYRDRNDISNGRLFADIFKDMARFNETAKAWYCYNGVFWQKDPEGMRAEGYAQALSKALLIYSAEVGDIEYTKFVNRLQDRKKRMTMLQDAKCHYCVTSEDFDTDPYLFNCRNGVVNLHTQEFLEHDPELMLSKVSNVWYDKEAESELFGRFISEILCEDQELIQYMQELFGYALTGENTQEECYMCYGETTRNGKSTLLDTMEYLFGDYSMNMQPETLAKQERNSRNASGDIARLAGARLLHMSEPPRRMNFDVALLKQLIGRDLVTARHLHEAEFEFVPVFKLFINTNYLPLVTDDTVFASGRVKVIPFNRHFTPEEQDIHLKKKLKSRANISGIFNWILAGLARYLENGEILEEPDAVKKATEAYRVKSDKIQAFISETFIPCSTSGFNTIQGKKVYELYTAWCQQNGYKVENKGNFFDDLRHKGLLCDQGTIDGRTIRNVLKGFALPAEEVSF